MCVLTGRIQWPAYTTVILGSSMLCGIVFVLMMARIGGGNYASCSLVFRVVLGWLRYPYYGTLALGLFFVLYSRVGYIRAFFLLSVLINFSNDGCIALALVLIEWLQAK